MPDFSDFYALLEHKLNAPQTVYITTNLKTGKKCFCEARETGLIGEEFVEAFCPAPSLVLCGAGHVAKALYELAVPLGFSVTVLDDRAEFACKSRFPLAEKISAEPFLTAFSTLPRTENTYFAVLTRGHNDDKLCLSEALRGKFAYVGMIGSRRKNAMVLDTLQHDGFSKELLGGVHAPIGLAIGAQTPEEIAISIMAQLIQVKNSRPRHPQLSKDILRALAANKTMAMATLAEKKGSAPRDKGAKLLLLKNGTLLGTVGGGKSEGMAVQTMREKAQNIPLQVLSIDMTNNDASAAGMICGGEVKIVIEALN